MKLIKSRFKNSSAKKISVLPLLFLVFIVGSIFIYKLSTKKENSTPQAQSDVGDNLLVSENVTETATKESVCLDPGHGGNDVGASYNNIYESDINLDVAQKVKSLLEQQGYKVYMTRTNDSYIAKRARANYCNGVNADILVSIHHNSYTDDKTVDYSTALYYKSSDQILAANILKETSSSLNLESKGISKFDNSLFWVAEMPSAMSEAFFMTNKTESNYLVGSYSSRLDDEAEGIAKGIVNYFTNPDQAEITTDDNSLVIDRTDLEE